MQTELLNYLSPYITPERLSLFNRVVEFRTKYITVVLEDIFQSQNASAVLRSCDCFGIQDVHIIENRNQFQLDSEVSLGSSKWLTLNKYNSEENNSLMAIRNLKKQGYKIVATTPHTNDHKLPDFDITSGKIALVFGSELPGVSEVILNEADEFLKIPMFGFTESFNISVSAAMCMYHLSEKMRNSAILWQLQEDEKVQVLLDWTRSVVKSASDIEKQMFAQ